MPIVSTSQSKYPALPPAVKPFGSGETVCVCARTAHQTKEVLGHGLKIIRVRFSLGKGELPDLRTDGLKKYLLYLLGAGTSRPSCQFPRVQKGWDNDGFPVLRRLSKVHRWELAHSVASLARNLPSGCPVHKTSSWKSWKQRALTPSPPTSSPEYLRFVRKTVRKIFRSGWDKKLYPSFSSSFAPRASARSEPLTTGSEWWSTNSSHKEFLSAVLHGRLPSCVDGSFALRYKEVLSAGKVRPLGIPSFEYDLLGPLHKAMYEHIASKEWLLKGPPTVRRIESVCTGQVQTSVDLVGATDGLRLDATEAILGVVLSNASKVPGRISQMAFESLRPSVRGKTVTHGQMMGAYLSFPLLCLHSYCAAKWAVRGRVANILVNGDDTLISSSEAAGEYPPGYELNASKTIVHGSVAEINSTVFLRGGGRWREVRNMRRGGDRSDFSGMRHMASACRSAGNPWVSAFIRSRIGSKWRFLPTQLDFPLSNHAAWKRQRQLSRSHTELPERIVPVSDRWRFQDHKPTYGERFAFTRDLFDNGRDRDPGEWNPRLRDVVSTYARQVKMRYTLSYRRNWADGRVRKARPWMVSVAYGANEEGARVVDFSSVEDGILYLPVSAWWR